MYELVVSSTKVKYKGSFELGDVYGLAKRVFESRDYGISEESANKEENPSAGADNFVMEMKATKKLDSYSKDVAEVRFIVDNYTKQEVFEGGHKSIKSMGELTIEIKMILQLDYENNWEEGILGNLRPTFEKVWYKGKIEGWRVNVEQELEGIKNDLKEIF